MRLKQVKFSAHGPFAIPADVACRVAETCTWFSYEVLSEEESLYAVTVKHEDLIRAITAVNRSLCQPMGHEAVTIDQVLPMGEAV